MCVYVKEIDCDNKENAVLLHSYTYDEGGFETIRLGNDEYSTPFILVYVGDLDSEEDIQERMEDIAEHTNFEVACTIQWHWHENIFMECRRQNKRLYYKR